MSADMLSIAMPDWLGDFAVRAPAGDDAEAQMAFVIEAARRNIARGGGGPFGAAVFEAGSGRLVSLGVNLVESRGLSVLHAEIVALSLAQSRLGRADLSEGAPLRLVSSAEPCAMCLGAIPWSGVSGLVCGARGEDVEQAGFDEGEKPAAWVEGLQRRGVATRRDVRRAEAAAVIAAYAAGGGRIYGRRGG